jgi:hypothetical protein
MKSLLRLGLVALGLLWAQSAFAACTTGYAYNPGNWATSGTFYTATNGGGSACVLTTGDAVVFDSHTQAGSYTIAASVGIISLTTTGTTAGVYVLHSSAVVLTLSAAGTYDFSGISYCNANPCTGPVAAARAISITNTSGTATINTGIATQIYNELGTVTQNGSGGTVALADNAIFQGVPVFTAGTLTAAVANSSPTMPSLAVPAVGILTCGTGTWTFTATSGVVLGFTTGATVSCASAGITFSAAVNGGNRSINLINGQSLGAVTISNSGATIGSTFQFANLASAQSATLSSLSFTNLAANLYVQWERTITITNAPTTWSGSSGIFLFFIGSIGITAPVINIPTTLSVSWMEFCGITFNNTVTATNSLDLCGGSTDLSATPPTFGTGGGSHIIGG